jgi:hypothetical protein
VPREYPAPSSNDEPRSGYPLLVVFRDIGDPSSVERVEPTDLAAAFGPGYALRRITVQVTDAEVTTGNEARLQRFGLKLGTGLDRRSRVAADLTLAERIGYDDFARSSFQ